MEFDTNFKRYKRFMKDNGLYARMMQIHLGECSSHNKRIFSELKSFLCNTVEPFSWIQGAAAFCSWSSTKEGDLFWWLISIRWQAICIKESLFKNPMHEKLFIERLNYNLDSIVDCYGKILSKEIELELSKYKHEVVIIYKKKYE